MKHRIATDKMRCAAQCLLHRVGNLLLYLIQNPPRFGLARGYGGVNGSRRGAASRRCRAANNNRSGNVKLKDLVSTKYFLKCFSRDF